jgi:hypothetical protein
MATTHARFPYALTLFRQGGTVVPPTDSPAPALPTIDMIPDEWPACAALRACESSSSLVPHGTTRIIFGFFPPDNGGALARVAFDFPADETAKTCRGPSVTGRTIADFRHLPATPARAEFY